MTLPHWSCAFGTSRRASRDDRTDLPLPSMTPDVVHHPVMVQRWTDVVFLHWRYDPCEVQRLLPPGVVVDEYEGSAWVALVPFRMEGLGFPGLAPLPIVGTFPEVNVRTYVRAGGRRGVWFFSLDVDRLLPALVARGAYHLPYCAGRADHVRVDDYVSMTTCRRVSSVAGREPNGGRRPRSWCGPVLRSTRMIHSCGSSPAAGGSSRPPDAIDCATPRWIIRRGRCTRPTHSRSTITS